MFLLGRGVLYFATNFGSEIVYFATRAYSSEIVYFATQRSVKEIVYFATRVYIQCISPRYVWYWLIHLLLHSCCAVALNLDHR